MFTVKRRVAEALAKVEKTLVDPSNLDDFIGYRSDDPESETGQFPRRYQYLKKIVPDLGQWPRFYKLELSYFLQIRRGIPLGVCQYLLIKGDEKTVCISRGIEWECECSIPRPIVCHFQSAIIIPTVSRLVAAKNEETRQILARLLGE